MNKLFTGPTKLLKSNYLPDLSLAAKSENRLNKARIASIFNRQYFRLRILSILRIKKSFQSLTIFILHKRLQPK